jgi:hypothetical protein
MASGTRSRRQGTDTDVRDRDESVESDVGGGDIGILGGGIPTGWTFDQYRQILAMRQEETAREREETAREREETAREREEAARRHDRELQLIKARTDANDERMKHRPTNEFNIIEASKRLSKFDERDVDMYLSLC